MIDSRTSLLVLGCVAFGGLIVAELYADPGEALSITAVGSRRDDAPAALPTQPVRLDDLLATSLARPLFSPTRRPPASAPGEAAGDTDLAGNRLAGIVIEPDRRLAIFAVTGAKALTLTEGESVDGWQIESITPTEVSLVGRSGGKTLQPTRDPNLPPPVRPPARANAGPQAPAPPGQPPVLPGRPGVPQPNPQAAPVPLPQRPIAKANRSPGPAIAPAVPQTAPAPGPRTITPPGPAR